MLSVAVLVMAALTGVPTANSGSECEYFVRLAGACNVKTENTGKDLVVSGTQTIPGASTPSRDRDRTDNNDRQDRGSRDGGGGREPGRTGSGERREPAPTFTDGLDGICAGGTAGSGTAACTASDSAGRSLDLASLTISDLTRFTPPRTSMTIDPFNRAVVGFPANAIAASATHIETGTLLGTTVRVRFTPQLHEFYYGDGTIIRSHTPGATWEDLGQEPFTDTDTSHIYTAPGLYTVRVDVHYAAAIDFGEGWVPVGGTLTTTGTSIQIQVQQVRTALVAHSCTDKPAAAGCP